MKSKRYYRNLYTSKINVTENQFQQFTEDVQLAQLSNEERESLEGLLIFEECKNILTAFKNDKSPGEDGFTAEFYLSFFDIIDDDSVKSLNVGYEKGKLSISQPRGLIPKEDSELNQLQNWRPITLLNVDYKIASKAIAKRIEPYITSSYPP